MARVKNSGTDIELHLTECVRVLWRKERYRKNVKNLPGKPDIVFPRSKVAVFADGDFWHGRDFSEWKGRIPDFWKKKIAGNIARDIAQAKALKKQGFVVLRFWGSDIKKKPSRVTSKIRRRLK